MGHVFSLWNIQANPIELLGWIKNAKLVITDTFHGSVMSIICNTPMIVKIRGNKNKLSFLLDEYGLSDRIIEDFSKIDEISKHIQDVTVNVDSTIKTSLVNSPFSLIVPPPDA